MKPTLWILIGPPGVGKSFWTRKNAANAVVASSDDIIMRMSAEARNGEANYAEDFSKFIGPAGKEYDALVRDTLAAGKDLVIDRTNMNAKSRRGPIAQAGDRYTKIAVVFIVNDVEHKRRLAQREKEPGNKRIGAHIVASMQANYQRPTLDEGFDKIVEVRS